MDGTFSTAIRTGAASAVASRILASPSSAVLGLVGCGVQAVTQLHALSRAFTFTEILVYDPDVAAESSFADRARVPRGMVRAAPLGEIERAADILCTATSVFPGDGPVIAGREMKPTVHINAVGSDMQGKTELPLALLRNAIVCPDDVMQARREGECQQLGSGGIGPSLTSLLLDPHENLGLHSRCTVYDSTGLALQDLAMAEMFDDFAQQTGIGEAVGLEACLDDPRDPYSFLPSASLTMPEIGGGSW
jgi:ornithine cyclodeaminase/alanine dehydrogenase-like protein (mu-crystallin family)